MPKKRGDVWGPLAYLSKQLDLVILGWPPCLHETQKLTRNAPLNVCSPHSFKDLLSNWAFLSLPPAQLQILHTHLLDPSLSFMPCKPLNPASLLPTPDPEVEHLSHDCVQTLDMTLNPFEHINDQPLTDPKVPSWFMDGSAQKQAPFGAGYTIVQGQPDKVISPLPRQVSHTPSSHILTTG